MPHYWKIALFIITIGISDIVQSECLYYNKDRTLYLCDTLLTIPIESREYELYDGTVSKSGRFVTGVVVDSLVQDHIDLFFKLQGTIHGAGPLMHVSFVVYDRVNMRMVTTLDSLYYPPNSPRFSEDENWLWITQGYPATGTLINTETGEVSNVPHPEFATSQWHDYMSSSQWFDNILYFTTSRSDSIGVLSFDPVSRNWQESFWIPIEGLEGKAGWILQVSPTCIAFEYETDDIHSVVSIFCGGNETIRMEFLYLFSRTECGESMYLVGALDKEQSIRSGFSSVAYYRIEPESGTVTQLFPWTKLRTFLAQYTYLYDPVYMRDMACGPDAIFFIRNSFLGEKSTDIIKWSTESGAFEILTIPGLVRGPIGIVR